MGDLSERIRAADADLLRTMTPAIDHARHTNDHGRKGSQVSRDENGRDVSQLRFSITDVAKLAGILVAFAAAWWALNNRTDANYLALNAKLDAIQQQMASDAKLRDQRDDTYVADQRQLKANVELLKIDVQDLKLSMAKAGLYKGAS